MVLRGRGSAARKKSAAATRLTAREIASKRRIGQPKQREKTTLSRALRSTRSGLEAIKAHPGVGLGRAGLLDVEAVAAVGRLDRRRPPQRRALEELLAEVLGGPDLARLDQRFD